MCAHEERKEPVVNTKSSAFAFLGCLALVALLTCATAAQGDPVVTRYWDLNGTAAGAGSTTPAGTWDTSTKNWNKNSNGQGNSSDIVAWSSSGSRNDAVFAAGSDATGSYVVTLSGTISLRNLTLKEGNLTLSGGGLSLTDDATWSTSSSSTVVVGAISGASNLIKIGSGSLAIGASSYSGTTTINDGTFLVNGSRTSWGAFTVNPNVATHNATLGGTGSLASMAKTVTLTGDNGTQLAILAPGDGSTPGSFAITTTAANGVTFNNYSRLAIDINGPNSDLLTITGNVRFLGTVGDELYVSAVNPTAGKYTVLSYTGTISRSTGFTSNTLPAGYRFNSNTDLKTFELIARPVLDVTANPVYSTIIKGGSTNVDVTVYNSDLPDGDDLDNVSVAGSAGVSHGPWNAPGSVPAHGHTSPATGTFTFSSETLGHNYGRVTAATNDPHSTNSSHFADIDVDILDHAAPSFDGLSNAPLDLVWNLLQDTPASQNFSLYNIDLPDFDRAGLVFLSITEEEDDANLFTTVGGFSGILAEGTDTSGDDPDPFQVSFAGAAPGTYTAEYLVHLSDQDLPGSLPQDISIQLTANVTPEPATLLLLGTGALFIMRRRRS